MALLLLEIQVALIQGNIVDVHFDSVEQCTAWGRRQVTVEIHINLLY